MVWVAALRALVTIPNIIKAGAIGWEAAPIVDGGISKSIERGDATGVALKVASVALGVGGAAAMAFGLVSNPVGWAVMGASLAISAYDYYQDAKHEVREKIAKEKAAHEQKDMPEAPTLYTAIAPNIPERQPSQDVRLVEAINPVRQSQSSPDAVFKSFTSNFTGPTGINPTDPNVAGLFKHLQQTALKGKDGLDLEPKDLLVIARKAYYAGLEGGGYLKEPAQPYPDNFQYPLNTKEVVEAATKFQSEQNAAAPDAPVQTAAIKTAPPKADGPRTDTRVPAARLT